MGAEIIEVAEGGLLFVRTASEASMTVVLGVQSHLCCKQSRTLLPSVRHVGLTRAV
jgi:hypothetical protein